MPRVCNCCGQSKSTRDFSWNHKSSKYVAHCRDCGTWLYLFRQAFGTITYPDTREDRREYQRRRYQASKSTTRAAKDLYAAFGIGVPK